MIKAVESLRVSTSHYAHFHAVTCVFSRLLWAPFASAKICFRVKGHNKNGSKLKWELGHESTAEMDPRLKETLSRHQLPTDSVTHKLTQNACTSIKRQATQSSSQFQQITFYSNICTRKKRQKNKSHENDQFDCVHEIEERCRTSSQAHRNAF